MMIKPSDFFDLSDRLSAQLFVGCEYVWQALPKIGEHLSQLVGQTQYILGDVMVGAHVSTRPCFIGEGARVEPGAYVLGPAYIGAGVIVRHGAFVRENTILLPGSVVGHATEVKNSILLPKAHAPHFNYVGDSILGGRVNLGAGTKLSNLGMFSLKDGTTGKRPSISIPIEGVVCDTELTKLGAILGDDVQTGCNAVLNPGCLIGPRTLIYAGLSLRKGYYPSDSIIKLRQDRVIALRM